MDPLTCRIQELQGNQLRCVCLNVWRTLTSIWKLWFGGKRRRFRGGVKVPTTAWKKLSATGWYQIASIGRPFWRVCHRCMSVRTKPDLPKITLPKFSGNYGDCIYITTIHNNEDLNPVKRFYYLKSCLVGEAATLISTLECPNENYDKAWSVIVSRYDNKVLILFYCFLLIWHSKRKMADCCSSFHRPRKNLQTLANMDGTIAVTRWLDNKSWFC